MSQLSMNRLLEELTSLRSLCGQLADDLHAEFGVPDVEPPLNAMNMCQTKATITFELCSHYARRWGEEFDPFLNKETRQNLENGWRIIEQTTALLVLSVSALEYSAKEAARKYQPVLEIDWGRRQYLSGIMGKSHAYGLIDQKTLALWDAMIEIRNMHVHNNGNAEKTMTAEFPNELRFELIAGKMTKVSLLHLVWLTEWAVLAYAEWCQAFLKRAREIDALG